MVVSKRIEKLVQKIPNINLQEISEIEDWIEAEDVSKDPNDIKLLWGFFKARIRILKLELQQKVEGK
jgi:hypothetical protein